MAAAGRLWEAQEEGARSAVGSQAPSSAHSGLCPPRRWHRAPRARLCTAPLAWSPAGEGSKTTLTVGGKGLRFRPFRSPEAAGIGPKAVSGCLGAGPAPASPDGSRVQAEQERDWRVPARAAADHRLSLSPHGPPASCHHLSPFPPWATSLLPVVGGLGHLHQEHGPRTGAVTRPEIFPQHPLCGHPGSTSLAVTSYCGPTHW